MTKHKQAKDDASVVAGTAAKEASIKKRPARSNNDEEEESSSTQEQGRLEKKSRRVDYDSDSVEQEENSATDDTSKNAVVDTKTTSRPTWIHPIAPRFGFAFYGSDNTLQSFIIYMAIRESTDDNFAAGLRACAATARPEVHQHGFQMDGTRHVTMYEGILTYRQVQSLSFDKSIKEPFEPVRMEIQGWKPWKAGCYLSLTPRTTQQLRALLPQITHLPAGNKRPCDHLSLYRRRGLPGATHFDEIRRATAKHDWGHVWGVSLRLKALGSPYDECLVLAGEYS